jgi:hypothetical protein
MMRLLSIVCAASMAVSSTACSTDDDQGAGAGATASTGVGPSTGSGGEGACAAGESSSDEGGCVPAGIPPEACAFGFAADGNGGCTALLPAEVCPEGTMAIPGDSACREVAPCPASGFGEAPLDAATQYVDGAATNTESDGTVALPWKTIQQAVDVASTGAIIAIASGTYAEAVIIDRPVRLWAPCPTQVEITGTDVGASVTIVDGGDGAELHDLTLGDVTIMMSGSALFDRAWIRGGLGVLEPTVGTVPGAVVTIRRSLIEFGVWFGVISMVARVEESLVQHAGVTAQQQAPSRPRGRVEVRSSVLEGGALRRLHTVGTDTLIEATVLRPGIQSPAVPFGAIVHDDTMDADRAELVVRQSIFERSQGLGLVISAMAATVEHTVVRDTIPTAEGEKGWGIVMQYAPDTIVPSHTTVRASLVERAVEAGLVVIGSDAIVESVLVRDTDKNPLDGSLGDGIAVSHAESTAFATVRSSRVEGNGRAGLSNWGATISVQGSAFFCNPIQLNGELDLGSDFSYADLGGNVCGCDGSLETCQVQSSQLEPPKGVIDPQL